MSNIQYFTDGEQATAEVLNRPLKDLEKSGQYMSKAQFEANAEQNREIYAGSGFVEFGGDSSSGTRNPVNKGITASTYAWGSEKFNNYFVLGYSKYAPIVCVEGKNIKIAHTAYNTSSFSDNSNHIYLPEAPDAFTISDSSSLPQDMKQGDFAILRNFSRELVKNGTFENNIDNWDDQQDKGVTASWDEDNKRMKIETADDATAMDVTQYINLIKGVEYTFSVGDFSNTKVLLTESGSQTLELQPNTSGLFIPSTSSYRIIIRTNADKTAYVDNLSIKQSKDANIISLQNNFKDIDMYSNEYLNQFKNVDSVSRQDLVFIETWHEKVNAKDIVYPYGNVQYRGSNSDGLSDIAEGEFSGADTYSLFGNWQEAGSLVGKGYKWSELSNEDKLKFAQDKENNIYKDGENIIQVRYRIRVIQGLGNDWGKILQDEYAMKCENIRVAVKGAYSNNADYFDRQNGFGIFRNKYIWSAFGYNEYPNKQKGEYGSDGYSSLYQELAIPVALVQRRNKGAFDPVHNPEGSGTFSDDKMWFETTDSHENIRDCFTNKGNGNIESDKSGRPDGLYYNIIDERDIEDLRMSSKKINDKKEFLDNIFNKAVANTLRGKEYKKEFSQLITANKGFWINSLTLNKGDSFQVYTKYHPSFAHKTNLDVDAYEINEIVFLLNENGKYLKFLITSKQSNKESLRGKILESTLTIDDFEYSGDGAYFKCKSKIFINNYNTKFANNKKMLCCDIIGDPRNIQNRINYIVEEGTSQIVNLTKEIHILNSNNNNVYRSLLKRENIELDGEDFDSETNWINLGDNLNKGGYYQSWKSNGIFGIPMIVDDNNNCAYPSMTMSSNFDKRKLTKKYTKLLFAVVHYDNGDIVKFNIGNVSGNNLNTIENGHSTYSGIQNNMCLWDTSDERYNENTIIEIYYEAYTHFYKQTNQQNILALNDIFFRKGHWSYHGNELQQSLIKKVGTGEHASNDGDVMSNITIEEKSIYYGNSSKRLTDGGWSISPTHKDIKHSAYNNNASGIKILPYLSKAGNNKAVLNCLYKEIKWSNIGYSKIYFDIGFINDGRNIDAAELIFSGEDDISGNASLDEKHSIMKSVDNGVKKYIDLKIDNIDYISGVVMEVQAIKDGEFVRYNLQDYVVYHSSSRRRFLIPFYESHINQIKIISLGSDKEKADGVYIEQLSVVKADIMLTHNYMDGDWGDDNKMHIRDYTNIISDDNNQVILVGTKSIQLPYFLD